METEKAGGPDDTSLGMLRMPRADAYRSDAKRFQYFTKPDAVHTRSAEPFARALQTRGELELDFGTHIGEV